MRVSTQADVGTLDCVSDASGSMLLGLKLTPNTARMCPSSWMTFAAHQRSQDEVPAGLLALAELVLCASLRCVPVLQQFV